MRSIMMSLPVRNPEVSRAFFAELGFAFCQETSAHDATCVVIDDKVRVLLISQDQYRYHINDDMTESGSAGQILIRLSATSPREVDELVMRAIVAGGRPWPLAEEGPDYSGSFQDPDGYLWQVVCAPAPAELGATLPAARPSGDSQVTMAI